MRSLHVTKFVGRRAGTCDLQTPVLTSKGAQMCFIYRGGTLVLTLIRQAAWSSAIVSTEDDEENCLKLSPDLECGVRDARVCISATARCAAEVQVHVSHESMSIWGQIPRVGIGLR